MNKIINTGLVALALVGTLGCGNEKFEPKPVAIITGQTKLIDFSKQMGFGKSPGIYIKYDGLLEENRFSLSLPSGFSNTQTFYDLGNDSLVSLFPSVSSTTYTLKVNFLNRNYITLTPIVY